MSLTLNQHPNVSPETRKKVWKAARELQYQPNGIAKDLKSVRTKTVGLVLSDLSGPFYSELIRGIQEVTTANGYDLVAMSAIGGSGSPARYIREKRTDGMIILAHDIDSHLISQAGREKFPIMVLDRKLESDHVFSVTVDNRKGAYEAGEHLIRSGYRKIAYLAGPNDSTDNAERFAGFKEAMESHGLEVTPKWYIQGGFTKQGGYRAVKLLAAQHILPEAFFAGNDEMAMGAMEALTELGIRVPADVAVVGFDDIELAAYMRPPLTTVRQPMFDMGYTAATLLFRLLDGDRSVRSVVLDTELIVRESCGSK